jgi:hypothetical protein
MKTIVMTVLIICLIGGVAAAINTDFSMPEWGVYQTTGMAFEIIDGEATQRSVSTGDYFAIYEGSFLWITRTGLRFWIVLPDSSVYTSDGVVLIEDNRIFRVIKSDTGYYLVGGWLNRKGLVFFLLQKVK